MGACSQAEAPSSAVSASAGAAVPVPPQSVPAPTAPDDPSYVPPAEPWRPLPLPDATASERESTGDTRLYLTAFQNDYVSVVDPLSGHALYQIPVEADQAGIAVSLDGDRLYVVDGISSETAQLRVFDTETWEVVHREPVSVRLRLLGGNPISLSPDGRWLVEVFYSHDLRRGWDRVFDTEALEFAPDGAWKLSDCDLDPIRLVGQPGSDRVYVPCHGFVAALSAEDLSPLWRAEAPVRAPGFSGVQPGLATSPDDKRLYGIYPRVQGEVRGDGQFHVTYHDLKLLVWETDTGTLIDETSIATWSLFHCPRPAGVTLPT